jgi:hypothetical protein
LQSYNAVEQGMSVTYAFVSFLDAPSLMRNLSMLVFVSILLDLLWFSFQGDPFVIGIAYWPGGNLSQW